MKIGFGIGLCWYDFGWLQHLCSLQLLQLATFRSTLQDPLTLSELEVLLARLKAPYCALRPLLLKALVNDLVLVGHKDLAHGLPVCRKIVRQAHCWKSVCWNLWDVSSCSLIFWTQVEVVNLLLIDCIYKLRTSSCHLLDSLLLAHFTDRVPCRPVMEILPQDAWQHWAFSMRRGWVNDFFSDSGGIHTSYFSGRRTTHLGNC